MLNVQEMLMNKSFCLRVVLGLNVVLASLCASAETGKFIQDRFAIGFWVDPPIGDDADVRYKEIADNLFVPFKTKKEGGTGLGLTITKKIIDVHGGTIRCETGSTGTRFTLTL